MARSSVVVAAPWGECGGRGDVAVGGHPEADGGRQPGDEAVGLGELRLGGGEADPEVLGFAGPALALGLGDAGSQAVADGLQAGPLPLHCLVCRGQLFIDREIMLNTGGMEFLGIEWTNHSGTALISDACGFVHTSADDGFELWKPAGGYPR